MLEMTPHDMHAIHAADRGFNPYDNS